MTPGQARAVAELRALDRWSDGIVTIRGEVEDSSTFVKVPITVSTQGVRRYPGGIPVKTLEDLEVWIPRRHAPQSTTPARFGLSLGGPSTRDWPLPVPLH